MRKQTPKRLLPVAIALFTLAACDEENTPEMSNPNMNLQGNHNDVIVNNNETEPPFTSGSVAEATLLNEDNEEIGDVLFFHEGKSVIVEAHVEGIEPGYHGFHLHDDPLCEHDDDAPFSSATGHYNPEDDVHGDHAGDMPPLYANEDGTAYMAVQLDMFTPEQLLDDGVAVMIHEDPDNLGHIPNRYESTEAHTSGPDDETLDTGDAGARIACGVVTESP
ncbi:superoxide dismutase family protein [Salipaludibacillus sp. LMS25]|jgi:Cu-Zn family superoxide dismutase|uniref:superoxide dismutase family protein n=1 Tax=Salipaludibacillus sp. LMS25 TaxID=2924031 RepID=UPI0020D0C279|nr:superoxide dismutase family protein [Salipaludibacillus sp. LMS25]UTR13253.1 superoxide dismutase family protein [Salipaludibacillus sp. LMS25]